MGGLGGFLEVCRPGAVEGLKDNVQIVTGGLNDPDGPVNLSLTALDHLDDEEPKQRVTDVGPLDLLKQGLQVAAVLLGFQRQEIAVGVGVVQDSGEIDFSGYWTAAASALSGRMLACTTRGSSGGLAAAEAWGGHSFRPQGRRKALGKC